MPTFEVQVEGVIDATVEVDADDEDEARQKAEDRGLERDDWFEIRDVTAKHAREINI